MASGTLEVRLAVLTHVRAPREELDALPTAGEFQGVPDVFPIGVRQLGTRQVAAEEPDASLPAGIHGEAGSTVLPQLSGAPERCRWKAS